MTMRSLDLRTHVPLKDPAPPQNWRKSHDPKIRDPKNRDVRVQDEWGRTVVVPWWRLWNVAQDFEEDKEARGTVVYGHDSRAGIVKERWSVGVDGGCVSGGKLAAFVIGGKKKGGEVVSVPCKDHWKKEDQGVALGAT